MSGEVSVSDHTLLIIISHRQWSFPSKSLSDCAKDTETTLQEDDILQTLRTLRRDRVRNAKSRHMVHCRLSYMTGLAEVETPLSTMWRRWGSGVWGK